LPPAAVPPRIGPVTVGAAPGMPVIFGVIGVAAVVAAAVAYWAGKREDAQAQVQTSTLRSISAADVASKAIHEQIVSGQPVDPALVAVISKLAEPEQMRSAGLWLAGGLAIGGTLGAVGIGALLNKRSA